MIALDSAYCCKSLRQSFLALLQAEEYFVVEDVIDANRSFPLCALKKFGQKLRSFTFLESVSREQLNMVAAHCHNLIRVHFNGLYTCIAESWNVLKANPKLECVTFTARCIRYSGPPSSFLSYAEVESSSFRRLARQDFLYKDQCLEVLKMNRNIVGLKLSRAAGADHAALLQIPHLCPKLTSLGLKDMGISNSVLCAITAGCPNLVHLDISGYNLVSDDGICGILPKLKSLNIQDNGGITDVGLKHLYTQCADTLHTLYITCYEQGWLTPSGINELLRRCTQLRTLGISADYSYLTGVDGLFQPSLGKLRTLVLSGRVFNNDNIASIGKYGDSLEVLCIPALGCYTCKTLMSLYDGCPKLKELYVNLARREECVSYSDDNPNIREFVLLALDLWKRHRPGLQIIETVQGEWPVDYDVMTA